MYIISGLTTGTWISNYYVLAYKVGTHAQRTTGILVEITRLTVILCLGKFPPFILTCLLVLSLSTYFLGSHILRNPKYR